MKRNDLLPQDVVSCIFTLTDDLDAEFPAVAARNIGFSARPAAVRARDPGPGSLPRVIRIMMHYYAPDDHEPRHIYLGEAANLRLDLEGARSSADRVRRARRPPAGLPGRGRLLAARRRRDARLQRVALAAGARGARGRGEGGRLGQRYPDPSNSALREALSRRYDVPANGSRSATGRWTC